MPAEHPERNEHIPNKEKPPFLYHGSAHGDISELEPRAEGVRDPNEGPVVFATQELALATIFMADGVVESGKFDSTPYAVINGSRENFIKNDKGGHVYIVPSDSFQNDPTKGLGEYEWTRREKVTADRVIQYASVLKAMLQNGIQVYFVDTQTHQKMKASDDHGLSILQKLESENQRTGINA